MAEPRDFWCLDCGHAFVEADAGRWEDVPCCHECGELCASCEDTPACPECGSISLRDKAAMAALEQTKLLEWAAAAKGW